MSMVVRASGLVAILGAMIGVFIVLPAALLLIRHPIYWFGARITLEERMLEDQFGDAYRTYRLQTKRLIPFVY
ncbi:MAG: hypothetical protein KF893_25755 [Caldilineaceae bacterium]|nr:hypothetical protein [Caldilineaceae bacterium]